MHKKCWARYRHNLYEEGFGKSSSYLGSKYIKGLIVFTEIKKHMKKPKFSEIQYEEAYTMPYDDCAWETFKIIKNQNFMHQRVEEIFDDRLVSLRIKSFYGDFYIKEGDIYTYIYYMPFANFNLMHYINFQVTNYLMNDTKAIVVCLESRVEYVRGDLDENVEVIYVGMY